MRKKIFPSLTPIEKEQELDEYVSACYHVVKELPAHDFLQYGPVKSDLYERNYIIVMSYHLGCNNSSLLKGDLVNGELCKSIMNKTKKMCKTFKELKYSNFDKYVSFIPDFVIHSNEPNRKLTQESQKLIMEAKTTPHLTKKGFNWDFFKLNVYLNKLKYRNAVYLILNTPKVKIDQLLTSYFKEDYYYDIKQIHRFTFIIQESINKVPMVYKLQKK